MYNSCPYVVLVEGEPDVMITSQMGINCVTQTEGASSWDSTFNRYFRGKIVYILYDNDIAGIKGAEKAAYELWKSKVSVYMAKWPDFMKEKEDHTDYFVKYRQSTDDYWKILKNSISVILYFSNKGK